MVTKYHCLFPVVPPPLGSAPPAGSSASATTSPQHHKPVRASLSSLSSSHIEQQVNPASGKNILNPEIQYFFSYFHIC